MFQSQSPLVKQTESWLQACYKKQDGKILSLKKCTKRLTDIGIAITVHYLFVLWKEGLMQQWLITISYQLLKDLSLLLKQDCFGFLVTHGVLVLPVPVIAALHIDARQTV